MVEFSPLSPEFQANPYPVYDMLRVNAPVFFWDQWGIWFLTRYEDCAALLKDARLAHEIQNVMSREELGLPPEPPAEYQPYMEMVRGWMLFRDPPTHTRLRMLVHKAFTPRMVENLRGRAQAITDRLLDAVQDKKQMDIIQDLAVPLPVTVIAEMLGVPTDEQDLFRGWSRDLAGTLELTDSPEVYERGTAATVAFSAYLRDLANARRKHPQDDLMSALVAAEEAGDKLTEQELIATCILLLVAGHETTTNLIGNGMLALLRHPEQLEKLRNDPVLIKPAIEEVLRYDSPVQMTSRMVMTDMEFQGQHLRKGSQVSFMLGAANRDPEQFANPDQLDISRESNPHLAFSNGIHYCLGAPLARLEGQIAISTLLKRLPKMGLLDDAPPYRPTYVLRGLKALPISV
ncbi:MAG: cytochrome P450 [Anaerolineae bacterium]|nr:cytochrome P450 [Anaerolineae bacterium]